MPRPYNNLSVLLTVLPTIQKMVLNEINLTLLYTIQRKKFLAITKIVYKIFLCRYKCHRFPRNANQNIPIVKLLLFKENAQIIVCSFRSA